jgi:hypothetical protein
MAAVFCLGRVHTFDPPRNGAYFYLLTYLLSRGGGGGGERRLPCCYSHTHELFLSLPPAARICWRDLFCDDDDDNDETIINTQQLLERNHLQVKADFFPLRHWHTYKQCVSALLLQYTIHILWNQFYIDSSSSFLSHEQNCLYCILYRDDDIITTVSFSSSFLVVVVVGVCGCAHVDLLQYYAAGAQCR